MNELQVFKNSEFGEIGILTIDGKEYFPATACAKILGYTDPYDAIKRHTKGSVKHRLLTKGGYQEMKFIPEGDLYRLITHSKLPAAEKFERWVFDEVLPAIRRQGAYIPDMTAVIAQTVQATISEVIQQLVPAILQAVSSPPVQTPPPHRHTKRMCIIGTLDTELRDEAEDMILSNRYTYADIAAHFSDRYGIRISKSAVGRYAKQLYAQGIDY